MTWKQLLSVADGTVKALLLDLPPELAEAARQVPALFEPTPNRDLLDDGWTDDLLGLFVGLPHPAAESGAQDVPPQILLFLENLWEFSRHNLAIYRDEVRKTYLHELGHYLGLDEGDLFNRELH